MASRDLSSIRRVSMRTHWKLGFTLLSPLLGVLIAEVLVRALVLQPVPEPHVEGLLFKLSSTPGLTYENRPGALRRTEYRERPGEVPRVVEQRINAQGFRGPEVEPKKPADVYRIACLGDSHTFGTGVGEGETWPIQLQHRYDEQGAFGRRVEVMNCGVSAYDTAREVLLLRERVLAFEPDLVLLQYHANDVYPRNSLGWKAPPEDLLYRMSRPARGGWIGALRSESRLVDLCLDRIHRYRGARDEVGLSMEGYEAQSAGWLAVCAGFVNARDLLAEQEIDFALVLFPSMLRTGETLASHDAFQRVRAVAARDHIDCFDAEGAFDGLDVAQLRVHAHDFHANGRAYGIFARALRDWLATRRARTPAAHDTEPFPFAESH